MGYFLAAVAAVLCALVLAALVAFWWFKRWLRRRMGDYQKSAQLLDPRFARPARIQLDLAEDAEPGASLAALWGRCHALGFRLLADWEERNGAFALLRAARHESLPIALVLTEENDEASSAAFAMFLIDGNDRLVALSDAAGPGLESPSLSWDADAAHTPESALARLEAAARELAPREPDLRRIEDGYERAWAARIDVELARAPDRSALERRAAAHAATPAQIEQACEIELSQWHEQLSAAVLDRYRRASRIDAVAWERQRDQVHVVHDHLRPEDIGKLLGGDEATEALVRQFAAQGLGGIALYEKVVERTAAAQVRRRLGAFAGPVRAVVYGRDEREPAIAAPAAQAYAYAALDAQGEAVHGAVLARDSTDAHRQLGELGLAEGRILSEPAGLAEGMQEFLVDPEHAAAAARALREPLWIATLRAIWANKWLWAPPLVLLAWTLHEGAPYGWGDYLVFGYAGLALAAFLLLVAPMFLYNRLLVARVHGRWRTADALIGLLSALNLFGGMTRAQLLGERCKIEAARGRPEQALARWHTLQAELKPEDFAQGLVTIYDAAGDHRRMIQAQRDYLAHAPAKEMASVDLALSLARYEENVEEAEDLLARTSPQHLSELALGGHHFARGLICAARGQTDLALRQYAQALERVSQFRSTPLIGCLVAEINGYVALALKRAGRIEQADGVWRSVRGILTLHASCRGLVERYERA